MKRYAFLTIIFLVIVMAMLLSSCSPAPVAAAAAAAARVTPTLEAAPLPDKPVAEQPKPAASPTSIPAREISVTVPTQSPALIDAEVTADVLNVRVGPGMNHKIMGQLVAGQTVRVEGRGLTNEWVAVLLADGREGWVHSSYLRPSADLASLPVMEAYGGPLPSKPEARPTSKPSGRYKLDVSISYNQAEVSMAGFAPQRDVILRLAVPGEGLSMAVATATTDAQGVAILSFDMPTNWPDGSAVTQSQMELQVLSSEGKLMGKAKIYYQSGE